MPAPETKYRPYFTLSQLKHIEQCMLAVKQQVQVDQSVVRYIHKYIRDIEDSYILPAHTTNPRKTLEEKLELALDKDELADLERQLFGGES